MQTGNTRTRRTRVTKLVAVLSMLACLTAFPRAVARAATPGSDDGAGLYVAKNEEGKLELAMIRKTRHGKYWLLLDDVALEVRRVARAKGADFVPTHGKGIGRAIVRGAAPKLRLTGKLAPSAKWMRRHDFRDPLVAHAAAHPGAKLALPRYEDPVLLARPLIRGLIAYVRAGRSAVSPRDMHAVEKLIEKRSRAEAARPLLEVLKEVDSVATEKGAWARYGLRSDGLRALRDITSRVKAFIADPTTDVAPPADMEALLDAVELILADTFFIVPESFVLDEIRHAGKKEACRSYLLMVTPPGLFSGKAPAEKKTAREGELEKHTLWLAGVPETSAPRCSGALVDHARRYEHEGFEPVGHLAVERGGAPVAIVIIGYMHFAIYMDIERSSDRILTKLEEASILDDAMRVLE